MAIRIEVGYRRGVPDPRGSATLAKVRSILGLPASLVRSIDAYTIDAPLSEEERDRVRQRFTDAVTQQSAMDRLEPEPCDYVIAVGLRPGVTITQKSDPERARALQKTAHEKCFIANSVNFPVECVPEIVVGR